MTLFMKHALELMQCFFRMEISDLLPGSRMEYDMDKFQQSSRVHQRFTKAFKLAYDALVGPPLEPTIA